MSYSIKTILYGVLNLIVGIGIMALFLGFIALQMGYFEQNNTCVPRHKYTFKEGTPDRLVRATNEAVEKWEVALGDEKLFTYKKGGESVIGYGGLLDSSNAGETQNWNTERSKLIVRKFEIHISPKMKDDSYEDLLHLMVHELGHALGMRDHSSDRRSVMRQGNFSVLEVKPIDVALIRNAFELCRKTY